MRETIMIQGRGFAMLLSWWELRSSSMPTIWDPVSSFGTRWLSSGQCLMGQRWWWWTRVLSSGPTMKKKAQSQSLASVNMLFLAFRLNTNLLLLLIIKNTAVTHSINAFDQEFQSASELENLSFDIRQMKLQVIFKRGLSWGSCY